jgi:hypothetical protein
MYEYDHYKLPEWISLLKTIHKFDIHTLQKVFGQLIKDNNEELK